jgi:hypothetical protein
MIHAYKLRWTQHQQAGDAKLKETYATREDLVSY